MVTEMHGQIPVPDTQYRVSVLTQTDKHTQKHGKPINTCTLGKHAL